MRPRAAGRLLLTLTLVIGAHPASAQPSEVDRDAARTLVQQGDARMKDNDYEAALVAYRRADDIMGVPTTAIEVAKAELLLGHLVEAHAAFRKAGSYPVRDGEPAPFTQARKEARRQASELEARIPRIAISVKGTAPADVEVRLDGEAVDAWAAPFPLNPGPHELAVAAPGYHDYGEAFVIAEGERRTLAVTLEPLRGDTPPEAPPDEGFDAWPLAIAGFSVAGAGLILGALTGGFSLRDAAEAKSHCDDDGRCSREAADPLDRSRALAHVSTTSFAVAGVGAVIGIVGVALTLGDDDNTASLRLGPSWAAIVVRF